MAADRRDFITEATGRLNPYIDTDDMAQMTLDLMIELGGTISANSFAEFFTGKESYAITEPDKRDALEKTGELILHEELLCLMSNALTGHLIADWNNKCVDGVRKIAQKFYDEVLRKYGFTLTDAEEAALIDGSSKLYKGNEDKDDEVGGGQQEESEDEPNEADGQQEAVPVKRCGDCFHLWEINDEEGKCNCEDSDEYGKHKNKDQAGCSRWEEF
ncbi:MAG: hypothetical protein LUE27_11430 [Clostridia bacterium]|nr:hypothetical protein [Clostridia bacterium]